MQLKNKKQKRRGLPPPPPEKYLQEPMDATEENQNESEEPKNIDEANKNVDEEQPSSSKNHDQAHVEGTAKKPQKKRKKGIIYVSNIPKHMNVTRIREILGEYGEIGRVYLQPEKLRGGDKKKKKRNPFSRHFTEGWVEFISKRKAKKIVELLNSKQISTRKRSQFYDYIWSMKYLPRFKWVHLTERMNYEQATRKQRLMTEVSQARKETTFFQNNLDKSEFLKKKEKSNKKKKVESD